MQYDYTYDDGGYLPDYGASPKEPLSLSIFLVLPFLIGSVAVSALPGYNYLVIGLGALTAAVFLLASVREGFFVPTELKLLMAFFVWGILGIFLASSSALVAIRLRTLFQLLILAMIIVFYARNVRSIHWLFLAMLTGVAIVAASGIFTGEFQRSEVAEESARVAGFAMNANIFSRTLTYGIAALLLFFRQTRSLTLKVIIVVGILAAIRFVIASGSRQGFLGMAVLIFVWFMLTYGRDLRARPGLAVAMFFGLVGLGMFTVYQMRDTELMRRFLALEGLGYAGADSSATIRMEMIRAGLRMTLSNPILGVGLDNFRIHFHLRASHNNYVDVFSTTGVVGGVLYFMIYVVIFQRLLRLRKMVFSPEVKNVLVIFTALMFATLLFDFFVVSYYAQIYWIFLAIIIGYLAHLERQIASSYDQQEFTQAFVDQEQFYPAEEYV